MSSPTFADNMQYPNQEKNRQANNIIIKNQYVERISTFLQIVPNCVNLSVSAPNVVTGHDINPL